MKCCRVCYTENFHPQPILESNLIEFAKALFRTYGLRNLEDLTERHLLCLECKSQLRKSYSLIQKAVCGQNAIQVLKGKQNLTSKSWQDIKKQYGLFSTLGYHKVEIDYSLNEDENIEEIEVEVDGVAIKEEVVIKYECPEDIDIVDEVKPDFTKCATDGIKKQRKRKGRDTKRPPTARTDRKPNKTKPVIVETQPRPVDVTVDHIIEGKRKRPSLQLIDPALSGSDMEDIPLLPRKKKQKADLDEYCPNLSDANSDSSAEYCSDSEKSPDKRKRIYPRQCELCDTEVNSGSEHYRHYLYHHKEAEYPYKIKKDIICDQCGKLFRMEQQMTDHAKTHLGKKTIACEVCDKMFFTRKIMLQHRRTVHAYKKYFCDFCGKGFTIKNDMRLHIRTHTGEKPFKCHICGAAYAHGGNVLVHIHNVHQHNYRPSKKKKDRSEKKTKKGGKKKKAKLTQPS